MTISKNAVNALVGSYTYLYIQENNVSVLVTFSSLFWLSSIEIHNEVSEKYNSYFVELLLQKLQLASFSKAESATKRYFTNKHTHRFIWGFPKSWTRRAKSASGISAPAERFSSHLLPFAPLYSHSCCSHVSAISSECRPLGITQSYFPLWLTDAMVFHFHWIIDI